MTTKSITISAEVYQSLERISHGNIQKYLTQLVSDKPTEEELESEYAEMAADEEREREAQEWCEATISDVGDEPW